MYRRLPSAALRTVVEVHLRLSAGHGRSVDLDHEPCLAVAVGLVHHSPRDRLSAWERKHERHVVQHSSRRSDTAPICPHARSLLDWEIETPGEFPISWESA